MAPLKPYTWPHIMGICLHNTLQIGPSVNTMVSDFVYMVSGNGLQVNFE